MKRILTALLALALSFGALGQGIQTAGPGPGLSGGASCADANWASVNLLAFNNNGANGTTTITDQSTAATTLTANGSVAWSSTTAPTGLSTSVRLPGSAGDNVATSSVAFLGNGDFTLEWFQYFDNFSANRYAWDQRTSGSPGTTGPMLYVDSSTVTVLANGGAALLTATTPSATTWHHFALTRSGTSVKLWIDGSSAGTGTSSNNFVANPLFIGSRFSNTENSLGYIAAMRATPGVVRYTGTFTPPSLPLPAC